PLLALPRACGHRVGEQVSWRARRRPGARVRRDPRLVEPILKLRALLAATAAALLAACGSTPPADDEGPPNAQAVGAPPPATQAPAAQAKPPAAAPAAVPAKARAPSDTAFEGARATVAPREH